MSYNQAKDGTYELLGQYQSSEGQRVLDSFNVKTYPGDSNRAKELGLSAAEAAAFAALAQGVGKYIIQGGKLLIEKAQVAKNSIREAIDGVVGRNAVKEEIKFTRSQLQHAYDNHAQDFGFLGNKNNQTLTDFNLALESHVFASNTKVIEGTYRGLPVTHFVDPNTGLNVIRDANGDFLSGWKLSADQLKNVLSRGSL